MMDRWRSFYEDRPISNDSSEWFLAMAQLEEEDGQAETQEGSDQEDREEPPAVPAGVLNPG